ncbi:hypothetical protein [Mesorhizobium loti]|nr:hypothetical protein [Mesorhizobium loti]
MTNFSIIIGRSFDPPSVWRDALPPSSAIFEKYRSALISQPLSAVWRGHGSAIFLEFGRLSPQVKRNGSVGNSQGDCTVMIEWSWRIESEDAILCGSWSDEEGWEKVFETLIGRKVEDASIYGRLPELSIALTDGLYVASFMTAEGQPAWTIFDGSGEQHKSGYIAVRDGKVYEDLEMETAPVVTNPDSKIA